MIRFSHPAVSGGNVTIEHNFPRPANELGVEDARYLVIDAHGGQDMPFNGQMPLVFGEQISDYKAVMRDAGVPELAGAILKREPNGIVAHVRLARILADANRTEEYAIPQILKIEDPAIKPIKDAVFEFYLQIVDCLQTLMNGLATNARVLLLHSMAPYSPAREEKEIGAYIASHVSAAAEGGERRVVNLIPGPSDRLQEVADGEFHEQIRMALNGAKLPLSVDHPFHASPEYLSTKFQIDNPHRVYAMDIPKDMLCTGKIDGLSEIMLPPEQQSKEPYPQFNLLHPIIDPRKIEAMANIIAQALRQTLNAAH